MFRSQQVSKEEALKKIQHYCNYQERCHKEVKEKLYGFGLHKAAVEELMANMIENNYLNEERFAVQFAGGKCRINQWGRKKVLYELQQKGVNKVNITIALKALDEQKYIQTLEKLARRKWMQLTSEHHLTRQGKTTAYLLQKGYELPLITKALAEIIAAAKK